MEQRRFRPRSQVREQGYCGAAACQQAAAMSASLSMVNRAHMANNHCGLKALNPKPSGGRLRENMALAEEKALLAGFAKAARAGC